MINIKIKFPYILSQLFTNKLPGVKFRNTSTKEKEKIINSLHTKKNHMVMMKYQQNIKN